MYTVKLDCDAKEGVTDATWSHAQTQKTPTRASRFGRVDSFLDMGGFPSIQPINIYEQHVRS